jgi:1-deoxy-D-xylulose-5-phosphate synthase
MGKLLDTIHSPQDLRQLDREKLFELCTELRAYLIHEILQSGGHFSANLGTVELTVALHYIFNTPEDSLIWDVGHQAYGHKVLTGRKELLKSIRKKEGLSGFPNRQESKHDTFGTGHSSTSISAALGIAEANYLLENDFKSIAVIGDGSLTAGMAWEALNNGGNSKSDILVVINDNQMSIDPNLGALNLYLEKLQQGEGDVLFSALGWHYTGPIDGHDISKLLEVLGGLKSLKMPRILHIRTKKGKGYPAAEEEQTKWHAVKYVKLKKATSVEIPQSPSISKYQDVFGETLLNLAKGNDRIVGITPAMPSGSSMNKMMDYFPERVFDVGIAEQHAVTFSAGLALKGFIPFCNIYSSFFQRAYDQFIHDVCLQNVPVIFCLDRAGAVGEDGPTHHGMYDLAFLRAIPNCIISAPSGALELKSLMYLAVEFRDNPFVIRYPRGKSDSVDWDLTPKTIRVGKGEELLRGESTAILNLGALLPECKSALAMHSEKNLGLYDMRFLKPLDYGMLDQIFVQYNRIICVEDGCMMGGFYSAVCEYAVNKIYRGEIIGLGYPDEFVEHASRAEQLETYGLDAAGILRVLGKSF